MKKQPKKIKPGMQQRLKRLMLFKSEPGNAPVDVTWTGLSLFTAVLKAGSELVRKTASALPSRFPGRCPVFPGGCFLLPPPGFREKAHLAKGRSAPAKPPVRSWDGASAGCWKCRLFAGCFLAVCCLQPVHRQIPAV